MDAWTDVDTTSGFQYRVASEGGSGYIRRRVFLAALDGEQKLWQNRDPERAALDLANYELEERSATDDEVAITAKPRRKDILLFEGSIFVKPDGELIRIEGRLSKTPSFWTRRVEIVRRYGRVAGVRVPLEMESVAQLLIAGKSTFHMTYDYETINDQRVGDPTPRTHSTAAK